MKTKSVVSFFVLLSVISLVLAACNMPADHPLAPPTALTSPELSISLFSPANGSVYQVGLSIGLYASSGIFQSTITARQFLVNGASIAPTSSEPGDFSGTWTPTSTGEYYVQSKVTLADGAIAISEPARVCVVPVLGAFAGVGGYLGVCPLPTQIPNHASSGILTVNAVEVPTVITFSADQFHCYMAYPTVTFIVNVDDPQDLAALVVVNFTNSSGNYSESRYLNWITTRRVNQKEYRTTIEIGEYFAADSIIHWWVRVYGRNGETLQETQDVIAIEHAQCSQQPLQIESTVTPTLTPTPGILQIVPPTKKPGNTDNGDNPQPQQPPSNNPQPQPQQPPSNPQPSCPAGEVYTCDPVCGCAPG